MAQRDASSVNDNDEEPRFSDFLKEHAHGAVDRRITERLRELVVACNETGSKGAIAIKIAVGAKGGMAQVEISVKTNKPEGALPGGIYFATDDGVLVDEDPRQTKIAFKSIDKPSRVIDIERK